MVSIRPSQNASASESACSPACKAAQTPRWNARMAESIPALSPTSVWVMTYPHLVGQEYGKVVLQVTLHATERGSEGVFVPPKVTALLLHPSCPSQISHLHFVEQKFHPQPLRVGQLIILVLEDNPTWKLYDALFSPGPARSHRLE